MPQTGTFIECWSYALLSVGLARLFLSLSRGLPFFLYRVVAWNGLTGTIPAQISVLVELQQLWALTSF